MKNMVTTCIITDMHIIAPRENSGEVRFNAIIGGFQAYIQLFCPRGEELEYLARLEGKCTEV